MRRLYLAILFVSAAAIGYEILLMRVLSIVQWHHFAYMIISLALLGYGASGTAIALFREPLRRHFATAFAASALLFSISMPVCFIVGQRVPFNALELVWDPSELLGLGAIYGVFLVPFFFAAFCIGLSFSCRPGAVGRLYFFDLLGAGAGAIVIIAALFLLPPPLALLVLVVFASIASLLVIAAAGARPALLASHAAWLVALAIVTSQGWPELQMTEYKGLRQALQVVGANAIDTRTSPLGVLTVVDSPVVPFRHAPGLSMATQHVPPAQLGVFTDGDGMSVITQYNNDVGELGYLGDMTASLPYRLIETPSVLVLGAGGGADVLLALHNGARHVDAVELNPQMSALVRETHAEFAGRLYDDPRITLHTREARGFAAQTERGFDLVHIGLLDSFGASGAGVQAMHENYLYTVEGLQAYLRRLEPGGMLAITRWLKLPPRDALKLFATGVEALRRSGVVDPSLRLAMIRSWNTTTLIVKNGDLDPAEVRELRRFSAARSFDTVYFPGMIRSDANRYNVLQQPWLHDGAMALLGEHADAFLDQYKFYIAPSVDDRPYFFHFFKWSSFREVVSLRERGGAGLIEWGYLVLVATLVQAMIAGLLLILLPLGFVRRTWPRGTLPRMGGYFFLLGLAFLFIEMAFIQKFVLFLSHPLYAVAVVLAGFLVFAGIGSAVSSRFTGPSSLLVATIAIISIATIYVVALPIAFDAFMGLADPARIAISIALIAPLSFFMGMPFPLGLGRIADSAPSFIPWAWGINGYASVVSAALATLLAIHFGFNAVIVLAMLMYAGAARLMPCPVSRRARR